MANVDAGTVTYHDPTVWTAANAFDTVGTNSLQWQINASGNKIGIVFSIRKSGIINKLGVRIALCASPVLSRIGLYTVDSSGQPTTTAYGGSAYGTFTPAANTYSEVTLGTAATATAGDLAAMVIEFDSTAGDFYLSGMVGGASYQNGFPYATKYATSAWTRSSRYMPIAASVGYSDGTYPRCGLFPVKTQYSGLNFNSGSSPNEYAIQFTPSFTCRMAGIWTTCSQSVAGATSQIGLYSGTSLLTSVQVPYFGLSYAMFEEFYFPTPQVLNAGSTYYAAIKATSVNNVNVGSYTILSSASSEAIGFPSSWSVSQAYRSGGSWTSVPATIPTIGLILDQVNNGIGGGSAGISRGRAVNGS